MDRKPLPGSIWEIDPWNSHPASIESYERLFAAAFLHRYRLHAEAATMRPYVNRFLSFRVVPPWVGGYVREVLRDETPSEIANAPSDPVFDWRRLLWLFLALSPLRLRRFEPREPGACLAA